ncbi:MAG TPA: tetratricopeptide repeat protein [Melioribacteraceae bacterium]|nr:tetratricopeptide repeat protein [Melioribacteraceae bacterium]
MNPVRKHYKQKKGAPISVFTIITNKHYIKMPFVKKLSLLTPVVLLFLFNSCGVWTDFTTYFNTYYNARTLFDRTEEEILKHKKDPFEFREAANQTTQQNVPVIRTQPGITQTQQQQQQQQIIPMAQLKQDLTKVIEKCSKILQFHKESSYVDDALFMTGKAFYYQQEYASAQRKFLELSALQESEYFLENKLWLAKTYLQLRSFDEGLALIEEVKNDARNEDDEELFTDASITKIGFFLFREENSNAITECNWLMENNDNDEVKALVSFQLGKIYLKMNENENALNSFASVMNFSPTFEIEFESRLEHAKLLKKMGRLDDSESELIELRDGGKFNLHMDRILVEIGQVFQEKNEYEKAVQIFVEVDSTYRNYPAAGFAGFKLGEIYERYYRDYDSSLKYYNKATSSYVEKEIKEKSGVRARNIDKYFNIRKSVEDLNKQIVYIEKPEKFVQDSIDYDIAMNEFLDENRRKAEQLTQMSQQNQIVPQTQQINSELQTNQQQMQQPDLQSTTNKKEEITLKYLISIGKAQKPVRPKISVDSVNTLLAENYYNFGSHFFSELDVPDSANYYFRLVLDKYADKPKRVQTLFALATYYETVNEKKSADSLYQIIYDEYPNSTLFKEAGKKLGLIKEEEKKVIVATEDPAENFYVAAEELYYNKNFRDAIKAFRDIYLKYPTSTFTPKSIYYIGLIHEELKEYDSSAFYYGILSSKEYMSTPIGRAVYAKYTEYKNEQERIAQEEREKLEAAKPKEAEEKKETPPEHDRSILNQKEAPGKLKELLPGESRSDSLRIKSGSKVLPDSMKIQKSDSLKKIL